ELASARPKLALVLTTAVLALQWQTFFSTYHPVLTADYASSRTIKIGEFIRENTPRDTAIVVLDYDWSSEIAYYAQRKSLTIPKWIGEEKLERILAEPGRYTKPLPLSAYVYCRSELGPGFYGEMAESFLSQFPRDRMHSVAGCEIAIPSSELEVH
ncbi:MAG: hypothetical protein LJE70_11345, partial [Chromatiaceae bacterium]|nr:hypothetical protein [Chromatiaceae bacterium]